MIRVQGLSRKYGDFTAVHNASFEIQSGEVVGLLGHNGAGKTTIMKMLTGYLEPSAGSIDIDGLDIIEQREEIQQRLGYLPENSPIYPDMRVVDYLEYVSELKGIPEAQRFARIKDAMQQTEILDKSQSLIGTLSRGYKQRVGVAQALLNEPDILILDEPTNGLDPSQIQEMRGLIRRLGQKATVILSTHILAEVQAVCDRVIIMMRGEIAVDEKLSALTQSGKLLLTVDQALEPYQQKIQAITGVNNLSAVTGDTAAQTELKHYELEITASEQRTAAAAVNKLLVESGVAVYELALEKRNLEALFHELSTQGAVNIEHKQAA